MDNKTKYRELCQTEETISIFSKDWWLDTVCGKDNWDVLLIEKGGEIIACLPYGKNMYYGFNVITMPIITQTMGPWIKYPLGQKYTKRLAYEKEVFFALIDLIPNVGLFQQNFHYSISNWLPFYWKGFMQTTRYTYILEDINDFEKIYNGFQSNIRREIKKAEKIVKIYSSSNLDEFYNINKMTFQRQNKKIPYSLEFLKKLDDVLKEKKARKMFFAEDSKKNIHAAIYIIWDNNSAYYLMGGGDPELRNSGAMSLLMWEAIKFSSQMANVFNFEGSMIEPIERFFRGFGAIQKPYYVISKKSKAMQMCFEMKSILKILTKG